MFRPLTLLELVIISEDRKNLLSIYDILLNSTGIISGAKISWETDLGVWF